MGLYSKSGQDLQTNQAYVIGRLIVAVILLASVSVIMDSSGRAQLLANDS
jgi:hypothetical protein